MIAIVDYGVGNLASVQKALGHLKYQCAVTSAPESVARASKIILPGVGHFAATRSLRQSGMAEAIQIAMQRGSAFLGICVGMQWIFAGSEEAPEVPGLGIFPEVCHRFPKTVKSPHVGWNTLRMRRASRLLRKVACGSFVYYTHSYRAPVADAAVGESEYGGGFAAVVERDNVFGVQFHPEKSGNVGLQILTNFCELPC